MTDITQIEVKSPCIGVCAIDEKSGYCQGCFRNLDEIKKWWEMDQQDQLSLLLVLEERHLQLVDFN